MKYMLCTEIYSTHEHVISHPKPVKVFDSLVKARAYAYKNVPYKGWFIVQEKGRPNDRFEIHEGNIWREKNGDVMYRQILRYGDYGKLSKVHPDGTIRQGAFGRRS